MTQGESPWLSESEQQAWRHYLHASRRLDVALDRDLLEHGMSLAEYEIISMLSEADHMRMRMSALADLVVQSRSRITHTAKRLETRGWVERQKCTTDSRGVELVLTAQGLEALRAAARLHVEGVRRYFVDAMSPRQFAVLGQAMEKVSQATEERSA